MAVGQTIPTVEVYSARIITSDPSTGKIEAVLPGSLRQVMISGTPVAFRWPVANEVWRITNMNGTFYLDSPLPIQENSSTSTMSSDSPNVPTINTVQPGDAVINSPTGEIWVLGDASGANCFNFGRTSYTYAPAAAPKAPTSGFTVYVDQADGILKTIASSGKITTLATP